MDNMTMIPLQYIIAFAMAVVNTFKKNVPSQAVPFITMAIAIVLHVANAWSVGENLQLAAQIAFIQTGIAVGMFVLGDKVRKLNVTPMDITRHEYED